MKIIKSVFSKFFSHFIEFLMENDITNEYIQQLITIFNEFKPTLVEILNLIEGITSPNNQQSNKSHLAVTDANLNQLRKIDNQAIINFNLEISKWLDNISQKIDKKLKPNVYA